MSDKITIIINRPTNSQVPLSSLLMNLNATIHWVEQAYGLEPDEQTWTFTYKVSFNGEGNSIITITRSS